MRIEEVEGIGPAHATSLTAAGVPSTEELLTQGATTAGRARLAEATGISHKQILTWVNLADLMRIKGVGPEYSELLEAAGVDSPAELAHRNPANLETTFQEVVAARPEIVRRIPTEAEITDWIEQSKSLPKVVEHGGGHAAPEDAEHEGHDHAAHDHAEHDHAAHDHAEHEGHDHTEHDRAEHDHAAHEHEAAPAAAAVTAAEATPAPIASSPASDAPAPGAPAAAPAPVAVASTPAPAPAAPAPAAPAAPAASAATSGAETEAPKGLLARLKAMLFGA
jgi:predicted flap endonuclease-1-like 5' DNA nuclease